MKKILAWITFLLFPALFASVFFANRAEAGEYRLQTPNFQVEATANPFGVAVKDGRGADILKHDPQAGAYLLKGDQKLFLKGCTEKSHSEGAALSLECAAGEKAVAVEIAIESDFEFSLTLEVPEIAPFDRLGHRFALPEGESIYGLKEHVVGDGKGGTDSGAVQKFATLDQRGSTVEMYVRPTISIYSPFHINSRGFGLFFDTSWPGVYDLGDTEPEIADIGFEGKRLAMHFTYGPGFGDIIERHTDRVGKSILPPIWAAQVFKWRDDHINLPMLYDNSRNPSPFNSMVYEDIKMLKDLGIPTGVYWLDRPWAKGPFGYDDFEFDPIRFPKAGEMIQWLENKAGMKTLLWVAPWAYGKMREVAWAKRYIAPNIDKVIDLTNPKAVEWWQDEFHKMFDLGVAGFKLDRAEEVVPSAYEDLYHDGRSGREVHNQYPMLYAKAVQGACQKFRGDDCLVMPRSGFTGSQKYAVFWGGDTHASWRGLRSAVISCLRAGLMGFSVWGSDTGGYGEPESQDLFSRWLQVSAFHPLMEVGGSGSHEPWAAAYEPHYDQVGIDNYRLYAKVHTELAPYNYSMMNKAHTTGRPIVRPLVYNWPDDPRVADIWDEFMFGDAILAAPVLQEGARSREVYLPEGEWIDFWNQKDVYDGRKNYLVDAPIEKIPVFIRQGSIVPLQIVDGETGWAPEWAKGALVVAVFPGDAETRFDYFDGKSVAPLSARIAGVETVVDASALAKPALYKVRSERPETVSANGQEMDKCRKEEAFLDAETCWMWRPNEKAVWIKSPTGAKFVVAPAKESD